MERRTRRSPRMGGAAQKSRADRRQLSDSSDTGRSSDSGTDDASTHDTASEDTSDKDLVPISTCKRRLTMELWNLLPPELRVPKVVVDEIAN